MPSLMCMLSRVSRCAALYQSRRLEGTDLKPPHGRYLMALCREPGLSQEQLAKKLYVDKSQVARHLAYLEEKGYVIRSPGEDKRVLRVYLTERAEGVLPEVRRIFREWNAWLTAGFSEEEQAQFLFLMEKAERRAVSYAWGGEDTPLNTLQEE